MQFFLYLIVGGLSFVVDIGVFVGLREAAIPVITASVMSFIAATIANYQLSLLLAFERGRFRRHIELMRFLMVVLVGLGLNTALVWCFVYPCAMDPTVAKIVAVPIVLAWNYLGRQMLVFKDRIPVPVQAWLRRAATFCSAARPRSRIKAHPAQPPMGRPSAPDRSVRRP